MAKKTNPAHRAQTIVADICLYGNPRTCGSGYLGVCDPDGQSFGTGEPVHGRSFTEAIWNGLDDLVDAKTPAGLVRIFDAGGTRMATIGLSESVTYGSLTWVAAPVFTISAEALIAASEAQ